MKKTVLSLLMMLAATALFGSSLRIDIAGLPDNVQPQDFVPADASCRTLNRAGGLQRSLSFPATAEWREFSFSITSPEERKITLSFRSTDSNWVVIDDVAADNARLKNGTFEKIPF